VLVGAHWSVHAEEADVVDLFIDEVGLKIIKGLHSIEAGLVIVIWESRDKAKVEIMQQDKQLALVMEDSVHYVLWIGMCQAE
jgi:hypothetical protein